MAQQPASQSTNPADEEWTLVEEIGRVKKGATVDLRVFLKLRHDATGVVQIRKYKLDTPTMERVNLPVDTGNQVGLMLVAAHARYLDVGAELYARALDAPARG